MATGPAHSLGARRHPLSGNRFCKFAYLKCLRGLATAPQLVLRVLADYADENGRNAHPGIPRLATDCGMGESTVRRHLKWLEKNGYVVQESRGHNVGAFALASVYSLTLPDLPLTGERKPTAQSEAPTARSEQTYRSNWADLPLTGEHLPDPLSDPSTSDPSLASRWDNDPRWEELDNCDPGWDAPRPLSRRKAGGTDDWPNAPESRPGPRPLRANTIGTEPNTFADAEYDDTEAFYAFAAERESA